jgi:hypothetical protein
LTILSVTGHREVPNPNAVRESVRKFMADEAIDLTWTMLAAGADQLVAEEALAVGVKISAVIPFEEYEVDFEGEDRDTYRRLLEKCSTIVRMPYQSRSNRAYEEAGRTIVDKGERVLAIWDGKAADGRGGTAEIVTYSVSAGRPVDRIDPYTGTFEHLR